MIQLGDAIRVEVNLAILEDVIFAFNTIGVQIGDRGVRVPGCAVP